MENLANISINKPTLNLFKALAAFQQEVPIIHKGSTGYGYSYAGLPQILAIITPLLKKHGLAFTQLLKESGLETIVFHVETGEKITSYVNIPADVTLAKMNKFQVLGSGITYMRRYALSAMLGLVTDKDTDCGNTAPAIAPALLADAHNLALASVTKMLADAHTLDELKILWQKYGKHYPELSSVKDDRKKALTQKTGE